MLKKHGVTLNFSCAETQTLSEHEELREAFADPAGLFWQVQASEKFLFWHICGVSLLNILNMHVPRIVAQIALIGSFRGNQ